MKKAILSILTFTLVLGNAGVFAQDDDRYGENKEQCLLYLSYYTEYFKQKSYDEALPNWREAYRLCAPTARQALLIDGTTLMRQLIAKNARDKEYRAALVDTLLTLHDLRAQYYPTYAVTALNNKGLDLSNYVKDDPARLRVEFGKIIEANGTATRTSLFIHDLNAAIDLYQEGKLQADEVIETYQRNIALLDKAVAKTAAEEEQNAKVRTDLESLFISSKVASCENLITLFTPRYEENPNDLQLAGNIVKMMGMTEGCTENDLFIKAATTMYRMEPSYTSAYFLYRLNAAKGNVREAISYLEEAIGYPESDEKVDAEYSYELAAFCYKNGQPAKSYAAARKAAELDASMAGRAYFLIANIWGSTNCGGDEIGRRAPYWVAVDYLTRAKNADSSLTEEANRMIAQYSKYYPQTAEAFMYNLTDGQSYNVVCGGMSATTTVRTQR